MLPYSKHPVHAIALPCFAVTFCRYHLAVPLSPCPVALLLGEIYANYFYDNIK